ncbi:MAG: HU family DNA-binding protein [Bacteroidales bacterium]|nr:HU family DNA-binding protein [Bacteroidales bacterium]
MAKLKGIKGGKDNFTKKDLVDFVSQQTKITKKDTKAVLDSVFDVIPEITKSGGYITIAGFGTFKETKIKARTMKLSAKQSKMLNTSAKIKRIPASKHLSFSSSKNY